MRNSRPRVADRIISALADFGVDHLFGVGGANIEDLYDAAQATGGKVRAVVAKHEFSAVTMAEGYHRTSGKPGVVMATSGAGAMNLVPGLAEAHAARIPLLALIGQPPRPLEGHGAFQDSSGLAGAFDAVELFRTVSRFCARVDDPSDLGKLLTEAVAATRAPRRGPAVLLLPKDVQQAPSDPVPDLAGLLSGPETAPAGADPRAAADRDAAADLLADAVGRGADVLVVAGDGVGRGDARAELARLAGLLGAAVAVTPEAKDAFDNHDPRFAGVAGAIGHPTVPRHLEKAELCVLVGTRLPVMARTGLEEALGNTSLICYDPEPPFTARTVDGPPVLHVDGDLRTELRAAAERLAALPLRPEPSRGTVGGLEYLAAPAPAPAPASASAPASDTAGLRLVDAVQVIESLLPDDATVVSDAGNASAAAIHHLSVPPRGQFVLALGMGGMGHSFGAGIGAAFATGRRSYVLSGDGGFYAHGMEVHTAVEHDLPVTFVVFNNNAHAMCVLREQLLYAADYSYNTFRPADIAAGAGAMFPTLTARSARTPDELRRALAETNAGAGPALVCVESDPYETPPFVPFLRLIDDPPSEPGAAHGDRVTPVG
ncbi:thiamine pyrophosphate-binding protein [Streptomyces sp. NPDC086080]|uniref:thiamine pyrophosphate-binding protein n=1 Tax=Streptomyces sp. NPDC086080 TaxID=3365748 RepID=UPI0037D4744E